MGKEMNPAATDSISGITSAQEVLLAVGHTHFSSVLDLYLEAPNADVVHTITSPTAQNGSFINNPPALPSLGQSLPWVSWDLTSISNWRPGRLDDNIAIGKVFSDYRDWPSLLQRIFFDTNSSITGDAIYEWQSGAQGSNWSTFSGTGDAGRAYNAGTGNYEVLGAIPGPHPDDLKPGQAYPNAKELFKAAAADTGYNFAIEYTGTGASAWFLIDPETTQVNPRKVAWGTSTDITLEECDLQKNSLVQKVPDDDETPFYVVVESCERLTEPVSGSGGSQTGTNRYRHKVVPSATSWTNTTRVKTIQRRYTDSPTDTVRDNLAEDLQDNLTRTFGYFRWLDSFRGLRDELRPARSVSFATSLQGEDSVIISRTLKLSQGKVSCNIVARSGELNYSAETS